METTDSTAHCILQAANKILRGDDMKTQLAIDNYKVHQTIYPNAISCKFDNRRVTISKHADYYAMEFMCIDHDYTPHVHCELIKGKVAKTQFNLSHEAAELVLFGLAELMGFKIVIEK